jgi:predicted DNA-binding transcriptional regulator YafY
MSQERLQKMVQLLKTHRVVSRQTFLDRFEISPATFKRDLEYLRDRLGAPVIWDRERRGYRFDLSDDQANTFELPGLWFNSQEIHALLTMHQLIDALQPSLLTPHIEPLKARIESLLEGEEHTSNEVRKRIRILHMNTRPVEPEHFEVISSALLAGKRLNVIHYNRRRDEETERELSPQRLVFYRDNWYLDAWCHLRKGVRSFSVETLRKAVPLDRKARKVADKTLNGILASGSYVLEFPYSDDRELIMDILKHGPAVEVISPASLRKRIKEQADAIIRQYR